MTDRVVRPKDAASLILFRNGAGEPEVLMGRRPPKAGFMPDVYVFPGGKVDVSDSRAHSASRLDPGLTKHLAVADKANRAHALAMAAVRETFEETGLILGEQGDVGSVAAPSWARMRITGLAPALARLDYVARAITPTRSPVRFHARFFMVDAAHASGELSGSGELLDLRWVSLSQAGELPTARVTRFMLAEVQRLLNTSSEQRRQRALYTYRPTGPCIRYLPG